MIEAFGWLYLLIGFCYGSYLLGKDLYRWRGKRPGRLVALLSVLYCLSLPLTWLPVMLIGYGYIMASAKVDFSASQEEWDAAMKRVKKEVGIDDEQK